MTGETIALMDAVAERARRLVQRRSKPPSAP